MKTNGPKAATLAALPTTMTAAAASRNVVATDTGPRLQRAAQKRPRTKGNCFRFTYSSMHHIMFACFESRHTDFSGSFASAIDDSATSECDQNDKFFDMPRNNNYLSRMCQWLSTLVVSWGVLRFSLRECVTETDWVHTLSQAKSRAPTHARLIE